MAVTCRECGKPVLFPWEEMPMDAAGRFCECTPEIAACGPPDVEVPECECAEGIVLDLKHQDSGEGVAEGEVTGEVECDFEGWDQVQHLFDGGHGTIEEFRDALRRTVIFSLKQRLQEVVERNQLLKRIATPSRS